MKNVVVDVQCVEKCRLYSTWHGMKKRALGIREPVAVTQFSRCSTLLAIIKQLMRTYKNLERTYGDCFLVQFIWINIYIK